MKRPLHSWRNVLGFWGCSLFSLSRLAAFSADALIAVPISPDSRISGAYTAVLEVSIFDYRGRNGAAANIPSLDVAYDFVASHAPLFQHQLVRPSIDFPAEYHRAAKSVVPLGEYFYGQEKWNQLAGQSNAAMARLDEPLSHHRIMVFQGAVDVPEPGVWQLSAPVDDAVGIKLNGLTVHQRAPLGDMLSADDVSSRFDLEFFVAGRYPFEILFAQCEGPAGLRLLARPARAKPATGGGWSPLTFCTTP